MDKIIIDNAKSYLKNIIKNTPILSFYTNNYNYISFAKKLSAHSSTVQMFADCMRQKGASMGHTFKHAEKVAIEAASIIFIERGISPESLHMGLLALVAGYLHDYYRERKNHPYEACKYIENNFSYLLNKADIEAITFAISNHEAFKKHFIVEDEDIMLISNALYDADKFRWGPDNFVYTIWNMIADADISMEKLIEYFPKGLEHIIMIKNTFRTKTGLKYGPEFIEKGIMIAEKLLEYLKTLK